MSDAKRQERERRQRVLRIRRIAFGVAAFGLLGAVLFAVLALYRAPIFKIEDVVVSGAEHYSAEEIRRLAALPADATLLRLPASDIVERLEADPWIVEATLDRDFPSTLGVSVEERTPAAVVDAGGEEVWLVSSDGYWLESRAEKAKGLIVIRDVKELAPRAGSRVAEPEVSNAVEVVTSLSKQLRKQVVSVSAPSVEETALRTSDDVEIFIGEAVSMSTKDRIVREILDREKRVVYINVRVIDRPTWRGLDTD